MSYIDPTSVETIEVMAGVAPVSQGGESIGGSILVDWMQPQFAEAGAEAIASAEAGGFNHSNGDAMGANLSATAANESVSIRYSGAYATANNYRAGDGFKAAGPAAEGRGRLAADEVGSTYHFYEETDREMNVGDDKQFWYRDAPGMPMKTHGENSGLAMSLEYKLSKRDLLRSGADVQLYQLDDWWPPSGSGMMMSPNTFWNIRDGERHSYALFSEWQADWGDQWPTGRAAL